MVKQLLKKQMNFKRRSIYREYFAFLDTVKEDMESDDDIAPHFSPEIPHHEEALGLAEEFERAGLNPKLPGHWQFLLVAKSNFFAKSPTRVKTDWDADGERQLLADLLAQRADGPANIKRNGRLNLCKRLIAANPKGYPLSPESLRVQLQKILKDWSRRQTEGELSAHESELLASFDRKSPSRTTTHN